MKNRRLWMYAGLGVAGILTIIVLGGFILLQLLPHAGPYASGPTHPSAESGAFVSSYQTVADWLANMGAMIKRIIRLRW